MPAAPRLDLRLALVSALAASLLLLASPVAATSDGDADPAAKPPRRALDANRFPVPHELRPNVEFWLQVYTKYDDSVKLLHDDWHLGVIYAALDFHELELSGLSEGRKREIRRERIEQAKTKYATILSLLAQGKTSERWPEDQARVEAMFDSVPGGPAKYRAAISRMRAQTCLRNQFAEAIERSGYYLPAMERIFESRGLPVELTRLPFVESLFRWQAQSKVAAGGIWQFMPATGRLYLELGAEVDERYDPLLATDAAARFLAGNHEALRTWPLAITAYNHGRAGMQRAVRQVGTRDLGTIAERYRSRSFGFASRNFYAEFVAAWLAYENRSHYFPGVEPHASLDFDELVPEHYVALPSLAEAARADVEILRLLNPGLSREVWAGHLFHPAGRALRVPAGTLGSFESAYATLDADRKSAHQVGLRYRVRPGDTLGSIARRFGTTVRALRQANRISGHLIRVNQSLLIPPSPGAARVLARTDPTNLGTHRVRRGETLSRIASRYGTTAQVLQQLNGLARPDHLRVGQSLEVPSGPVSSEAQATHVVRRGETLAAIASRYGTTVRAIQRANRLFGDLIQPAQVLIIP